MNALPRIAVGRIALWLGVMAALSGQPAVAADTGNGSKNFRAPPSVPNYFSNEAGPLLGGAAESRRGELYSGAANPQQHQVAAIPVPPRAARVAVGHGRSRSVQERHRGRHLVAHAKASSHHVASRTSERHPPTHVSTKAARAGSNRHRRG
jgi:hypothetical protein